MNFRPALPILAQINMKDGEFKTVMACSDPVKAHIIEGMLRENGIPAMVFGEISSYPSMNLLDAIEVKVNAEDFDEAMKLIETPAAID